MIKNVSMAVVLVALLSACQSTHFSFTDNVPANPSYTRTMHYTWWGKEAKIEPAKVCGSAENVAMVSEREKTGQSWLRWLTLDIYQPVTIDVYCKRPVKTTYIAPQPK